jgi:sensor histidine kinase regulating citrate/malate metabolism
LTDNAIKAVKKSDNPSVEWSAACVDGRLSIKISDSGQGASLEKFRILFDVDSHLTPSTGLGLHLVRDLSKLIQCTIEIDFNQENGTCISLILEEFVE